MEIKKYLAEDIASKLEHASYFFLTDYQKITVLDVQELRRRLAQHKARFHVVKNTLLSRVLAEKGISLGSINGPTALVCGKSDASEVAKVLKAFIKEKNKLSIKSGALHRSVLNAADIDRLAELPSLDVMRAQFVGLLSTPARQFVTVCQAVPSSVARVLQAYVESKSA